MMRKMFIRLFACALALILALPAASMAEFSPRLNALKEKDGVALELTGQYQSLSRLSKATLQAVNDWLARSAVKAEGRLGGQMSAVGLTEDGKDVFSIATQTQENGVVTAFKPSGNAYLTGNGQKTAFDLIAGGGAFVPDLAQFPGLYAKIARVMYPVLESKNEGKVKKTRTTVKNAAASTSYVDYVFKADEMNALWPDVAAAVIPVIRDFFRDQPGTAAQIEELLNNLVFSGECRFKRLREKENGDMGVQFTGVAGKENDLRKVTVFGGYTEGKGGYLSVKMPAVKGKNTLTAQLSLEEGKTKSGVRSLKINGNYKSRLDGVNESGTVKASLRNTIKNDDEHWAGSVTVSQTKNGTKTTYTFQPDLKFTAEGLSGSVKVQRSVGGKADMKATVQVKLTEAAAAQLEEADTAQDLRDMSEKEAQAAVREELPELVQVVARWMGELPEDVRDLLTHELRTDEWMAMTAVDAAEEETEKAAEPEEETAEDETPADEEQQEEQPEDQPGEAAEDDRWEDAEDDGDWPAVSDADREGQKEDDQKTDASGAEKPADGQDQTDDDDWFGDDWFSEEIPVEGYGDEEEGDE